MSKYNAKKVEYKGIVFDSKVECEYYQYLESNKNGTNYDRIEILEGLPNAMQDALKEDIYLDEAIGIMVSQVIYEYEESEE